jgi:hypothetical protein
MIQRGTLVTIVLLAGLILPTMAEADFGLIPGSLSTTALNRDGTIDTQAGSHPYSYRVHFALKANSEGGSEGGQMRDVVGELPPGLFGNPLAVPRCSRQEFEGGEPHCSASSQVGQLRAILPATGEATGPVYNLEPPPGVAALLGFKAAGLIVLQAASVEPDNGYRVRVAAYNLPAEATSVTETIWGSPGDESHRPERGSGEGENLPYEAPELPFLTLPTSCSSPLTLSVQVDSSLNPGAFTGETAFSRDAGGNLLSLSGCDAVPFWPKILSAPTLSSAGSASGLGFELQLPNQGLLNPKDNAVTETEPVKTEVTLPQGITANSAAASGLGSCSEAQFKEATGAPGQGCPESSKLGTLVAKTPLLEEPIEGSIYLATPHGNRFNSLVALYIVARAPERGILVKQAGEVRIDPSTGQLTTIFDELPPVPYSSFEVRLREGPRAPLITPQTCGSYTTTVTLTSFANPAAPVVRAAPFTISSGAGGGQCASSEAQLPNKPTLEAGTTTPLGGSYSPFVLKVSRSDGEQRFSSVMTELPQGLTGKLAGIPYCSESQIAVAQARTTDGAGALELASPSCPSASQVGVVNVAAGAGSQPYRVQGKAYLAGPYKGAPLSFVFITPAIAGPFDLGVVTVRAAAYVDEFNATIAVKSDPLPTILEGIPLDVRSVSVQVDREKFTLNPTNCERMAIAGQMTSTTGSAAPLSVPFQVGGCKGLKFEPKVALSLKGPTRRTGHPALKAEVTFPKGGAYANIARAQVGLPASEFLDQGNLNKVCTRPQLRSRTCPKTSIYGHAKAWTPLLDKPLEGPVYLGVGFGYKLPALVVELNGQVRLLLKGKVDTTKQKGLRNTFEAVPDAPVSRFVLEMKGGKRYGLLENSENICRKPQHASAAFKAQNGETLHLQPTISNQCGKKKKSKQKHK